MSFVFAKYKGSHRCVICEKVVMWNTSAELTAELRRSVANIYVMLCYVMLFVYVYYYTRIRFNMVLYEIQKNKKVLVS